MQNIHINTLIINVIGVKTEQEIFRESCERNKGAEEGEENETKIKSVCLELADTLVMTLLHDNKAILP